MAGTRMYNTPPLLALFSQFSFSYLLSHHRYKIFLWIENHFWGKSNNRERILEMSLINCCLMTIEKESLIFKKWLYEKWSPSTFQCCGTEFGTTVQSRLTNVFLGKKHIFFIAYDFTSFYLFIFFISKEVSKPFLRKLKWF